MYSYQKQNVWSHCAHDICHKFPSSPAINSMHVGMMKTCNLSSLHCLHIWHRASISFPCWCIFTCFARALQPIRHAKLWTFGGTGHFHIVRHIGLSPPGLLILARPPCASSCSFDMHCEHTLLIRVPSNEIIFVPRRCLDCQNFYSVIRKKIAAPSGHFMPHPATESATHL
jgi:hypothetical protein